MNRRNFLTLVSSGVLIPEVLRGEHHVISADPLEVEFDLNSLRGRYTSVEDFYIRNHHEAPLRTGQDTLRIEGEVAQARELALSDFASLPKREVGAVLECAGNRVGASGLISNGSWTGWRLQDVLALARPTPRATHLHLVGRDGYARSVPLERAAAAMLTTHLNGRPLTRQHGAPWRALFPGWFGMDSIKWLERVVLARAPLPAEGNTYQEVRQMPSGELDRKPLPPVQVKSVIIDPAAGAVLRRGTVTVRGLAWSGTGSVASVEASPDGGATWHKAELEPGRDFEWWLWKATLQLARPGAVKLVARARDSEGAQQPATRDPARLDGYANNWYHRVRCVVV